MSKQYKEYFRYIANNQQLSSTAVYAFENSGSGVIPDSTVNCVPNYQIKEPSIKEIEDIFKEKYPLQYLILRKKFEKKMKKILKANEDVNL